MMTDVLEVLATGAGLTIQDGGRAGWKRFGLPPGGAMDQAAAARANRLAGNAPDAPVVEMLLAGARFRALAPVALGFADLAGGRGFSAGTGEVIDFGGSRAGVWSYLAIGGGLAAERWFGSASVNVRAGLGESLRVGNRLRGGVFESGFAFASQAKNEEPPLGEPPVFPVWKGPEWELMGGRAQQAFLESSWTVSPQSDRAGYRLHADHFPTHAHSLPSAPMAVGVIQVPPGGQPIVLLRDGPTVGGYPRLALIDGAFLSRFAQCAPATKLRFQLMP